MNYQNTPIYSNQNETYPASPAAEVSTVLQCIDQRFSAHTAHLNGLNDRIRRTLDRLTGPQPEPVRDMQKPESLPPPTVRRLETTAEFLGVIVEQLEGQVQRLERL